MASRILIVPDKFKGSLTAHEAAGAIAAGWRKARPDDALDLLPMSDGGDGFGDVMSELLGAQRRFVGTITAAHQPVRCIWWWDSARRIAIVESAKVNGLAMLSGKGHHPFQLDTYGLGKVLRAAEKAGANQCIVGVGGSATNEGGFGLARALGWKFFNARGGELAEWWQLSGLAKIESAAERLKLKISVAVDVQNPLLGKNGCSRVYGPQKGLREDEFEFADACLGRLAKILREELKTGDAKARGAGAAGGLGFGLSAFAGGKIESGFELFAEYATLQKRIRAADLVITAEGSMDKQTAMGKGVGQIAKCCRKARVPCLALAGKLDETIRHSRLFARAAALTDLTTPKRAQANAARWLEKLAEQAARSGVGVGAKAR